MRWQCFQGGHWPLSRILADTFMRWLTRCCTHPDLCRYFLAFDKTAGVGWRFVPILKVITQLHRRKSFCSSSNFVQQWNNILSHRQAKDGPLKSTNTVLLLCHTNHHFQQLLTICLHAESISLWKCIVRRWYVPWFEQFQVALATLAHDDNRTVTQAFVCLKPCEKQHFRVL